MRRSGLRRLICPLALLGLPQLITRFVVEGKVSDGTSGFELYVYHPKIVVSGILARRSYITKEGTAGRVVRRGPKKETSPLQRRQG